MSVFLGYNVVVQPKLDENCGSLDYATVFPQLYTIMMVMMTMMMVMMMMMMMMLC